MLKKLSATGILAGAATGVVLLCGPAQADRLAAAPSAVSDIPAACVSVVPGFVAPAWCNSYLLDPYYSTTYYQPAYYPPAYYPGYGWNRGWGGHWGGGHWGGGHWGGGHWGGGHGGHR